MAIEPISPSGQVSFARKREAVKFRRLIESPAAGFTAFCLLGTVAGAYLVIIPSFFANFLFLVVILITGMYGWHHGIAEFAGALVVVTNLLAWVVFSMDASPDRILYYSAVATFFTALGGFCGALPSAYGQVRRSMTQVDSQGVYVRINFFHALWLRWTRKRHLERSA